MLCQISIDVTEEICTGVAETLSTHAMKAIFQPSYYLLSPLNTGIETHLS